MELSYTACREGRLSSILRKEMHISSGLMNRLKWKDRILVDGIPRHTDHTVQPGNVVTCLLDEPEPEYPGEAGDLEILYEDAYLLAVDKPAGMLIHPSRQKNTGTLANYVVGYYGQTGQRSAFHPITRLDRDTFGVVLIGKNSHIHALMGALAREGKVKKYYEALVFSRMPAAEGHIDAPIARKPLPSLLREVREDGKPSVTQYRVLETGEKWSKVRLRPVSGRTHQLRVHCAYLGCPILGDPQYASPESAALSQQLGLETQLLCAKSVELIHPITGKPLQIESKTQVCIP